VIVDLTDTTAGAIAAALVQARHSAGVPAVGMVMTLVIVTDESVHYDALRAALDAAREHPSRILVTILNLLRNERPLFFFFFRPLIWGRRVNRRRAYGGNWGP